MRKQAPRFRTDCQHARLSRRSRRGFTIVESVCALMVLSLYIGGACQLALTTRMVTDQAREHYQAVTIAKNRLERVRVLPFDQLDLFAENDVRVNQSGVAATDGRFRRTTVVASQGSDVKEIRVRVDIRSHLTLKFQGEGEEVTSCIARFQLKPS